MGLNLETVFLGAIPLRLFGEALLLERFSSFHRSHFFKVDCSDVCVDGLNAYAEEVDYVRDAVACLQVSGYSREAGEVIVA